MHSVFLLVLLGSLGISPHATKNIYFGYCIWSFSLAWKKQTDPRDLGLNWIKGTYYLTHSCAYLFSLFLFNGKNLLKWTRLLTNNYCLPWQVRVPEHVSQHEINGKSISLSNCHQYLLALSQKNVCTCSTDRVLMWSEWSDFNMSWAHRGCSHTCTCGHVISFCQV